MDVFARIQKKLERDGLRLTLLAALRKLFSFWRKISLKKVLRENSVQERFRLINQKNLWGSSESRSGRGSEIAYTENLRRWLIETIPKYKVKRLLDAPCGDMNWMILVLRKVDVDYVGIDIVEDIINLNKRHFEDSKTRFQVANICEDTLPECDMLIVRDFLFHLSYADIDRFLRNISNLRYNYLLTTTIDTGINHSNSDIITGDFRCINLFSHPFNFPKSGVIDNVNDFPDGHPMPKKMILLKKDSVPKSLATLFP